MWRVQITLVVISVVTVLSLAINVVILLRSGDETAGSSLGQISIEQPVESLGTQLGVGGDEGEVRRPGEQGVGGDRDEVRRPRRQDVEEDDEDEERRLREEEEEQGRD